MCLLSGGILLTSQCFHKTSRIDVLLSSSFKEGPFFRKTEAGQDSKASGVPEHQQPDKPRLSN